MNNLTQSIVLAELARAADLSPTQQICVANWLLDHNVRFASQEQKNRMPTMIHGMPVERFQLISDLCSQDKRIQAIKEVRQWATDVGHGPTHPLGTLKGAKDFIDEHFPRPEPPGPFLPRRPAY